MMSCGELLYSGTAALRVCCGLKQPPRRRPAMANNIRRECWLVATNLPSVTTVSKAVIAGSRAMNGVPAGPPGSKKGTIDRQNDGFRAPSKFCRRTAGTWDLFALQVAADRICGGSALRAQSLSTKSENTPSQNCGHWVAESTGVHVELAAVVDGLLFRIRMTAALVLLVPRISLVRRHLRGCVSRCGNLSC